MKFVTTTLIVLALTTAAYSQEADKTLAKVKYSFSHIRDTTQKDKPYTENMLLFIGKNASLYTSYDKIEQNKLRRKQILEQVKNAQQSGSPMAINISGGQQITTQDYFYFANEKKLYTKENMVSIFLIEEPTTKIDWKISKDTTSFSGVHCQKATARFKGRNWIAWFASELPFQSGPWKLNGLPGLIVEAYDDKKEVQFKFEGIEDISKEVTPPRDSSDPSGVTIKMSTDTDSGNEIKLPLQGVKVNPKEFARLKQAQEDDPEGFFNSQKAVLGVNVAYRASTVSRNTATDVTKKAVINNPIELAEKK